MRDGRALLVDDATLIPPKVLAVLYPAMDGRRTISIPGYRNERVDAVDGFYVIAGHNPGVHGAILTEALASRFDVHIEVTTDFDLARHLGVPGPAVQAAQTLNQDLAAGRVSWAPQLRELLGFTRVRKTLGLTAAVANLAGRALSQIRCTSRSTIGRMWKAFGLKPHLVDTFKLRRLAGQKIVKSLLVRAATRKSVEQLSAEIHAGMTPDPGGDRRYRGTLPFLSVPRPVRSLAWRAVMGNPHWVKRFGGTVGMSSVGTFGPGGGWGIPIASPTLMVTVGGIATKPRYINGSLEPRELLDLTISVDHDIVDGAPAARFARWLTELVEQVDGLG
jgi:hypothetical protein